MALTDFSHILVVIPAIPMTVVTAPTTSGNPEWPRVGIFAQRKTAEQTGVSVCELLEVDDLNEK